MDKLPDIPESKWRWPHFTRSEMKCSGNGECRMSPVFMDRLERLREAYGKPMLVSSGYRSPEYNSKVSDTGSAGPHTYGRAVDIRVQGHEAYELLCAAVSLRFFTGIGIKQTGVSRFLHFDDLTSFDGYSTRPWLWTYSK